MRKILVIGSSFAGMTAALELKSELGDTHEITVVSKTRDFVFLPSLIWVPFDLRHKRDITFPLAPMFASKGVAFRRARIVRLNLAERSVVTEDGDAISYDGLVIATGPKLDFRAVPGLGPTEGFAQSIFTLKDAEQARGALEDFEVAPGPVVVGAVQGASYFTPAYEFLLNLALHLRKRRLAKASPLTFVTPEPFLGHFGTGNFGDVTTMLQRIFKRLGVTAITNATVQEVREKEIVLAGGRSLPFAYAMLTPPFIGVDPVRACKGIVDDDGFVEVNDFYQTRRFPEVFAAGVAVSIKPTANTPVLCGVPKSGYLSEAMARVVARNIVSAIRGQALVGFPPSSLDTKFVLDAGNTGILMTTDRLLQPPERTWIIRGPEAHWAKVAFEKYFIASRRRGRV